MSLLQKLMGAYKRVQQSIPAVIDDFRIIPSSVLLVALL